MTIRITMNGGLVQEIDGNAEQVEVIDFDTDGATADDHPTFCQCDRGNGDDHWHQFWPANPERTA